jgi:hypothetical protein
MPAIPENMLTRDWSGFKNTVAGRRRIFGVSGKAERKRMRAP